MSSPAQCNLIGYSFAPTPTLNTEKCNLLGYTSPETLPDSDLELFDGSGAEARAFGAAVFHLISDMTLAEDDCA